MTECWATFSRGIASQRDVVRFLEPGISLKAYHPFVTYQGIVGWGFKPTAKRARQYAANHHLPYVALEDGFLRSIGLGVSGAEPLSLVVDDVGIYYESRQPSRLEQLILANDELSDDELERSRRCISAIREHRLTKYNQIESDRVLTEVAPKILVIDQTQGDASVIGANADNITFVDMLRSAVHAHPDETVWVKVHPDVLHGKKKGFLYPLPFEHPNIRLYSKTVNPWDFLDSATDVYTVSSLMGFEALMAGCRVQCFGLPFYAGWGLTKDQQFCERRNVPRLLEQVFHAAYIQYARYVDPILKERCQIERIISYLSDQVRQNSVAETSVSVSSLSWWKQRWINDFIEAWRFVPSKNGRRVEWGRNNISDDAFCIEDGFIRSVGLGVHFNRPVSLVCDRHGAYFDARTESDLEIALEHNSCSTWACWRARQLIEQIHSAELTKYNIGSDTTLELPFGKKIVFVPGQVEGDASIRYGSPKITTNKALLNAVRDAEPDAYIIYKPHPDVVAGQRDDGIWQGDFLDQANLIVTEVSMSQLLKQVDEVHTMTSLTGFEALLRGKKVTTYGIPFYSGWGLTIDKLNCPRRTRRHSIESLVYFVLIIYPTYVDPLTRNACSAEQAIERISQIKAGSVQIKDHKLHMLLWLKSLKKTCRRLLYPLLEPLLKNREKRHA